MSEQMHCDICDQVLKARKSKFCDMSGIGTYWEIKEHSTWTGLMKLQFHPFGHSSKDLTVCENCIDDFKEFIQRKKSFLNENK